MTDTLPFIFPYQSTMLALCNGAVPDFVDDSLWQDYLAWQRNISEDDLFNVIIEESKPTFAPLSAADRQNIFSTIGDYLPATVQAAYQTCPYVIAVTCSAALDEFVSAPFWGAITFASFLASCSDGMVIDLLQLKAFAPSRRVLNAHNSAIPFTDLFLSVIGSEMHGVYEMKSRGNVRFGLPEVAMLDVSEEHTSLAAMVIRTYVQQLWTEIEVARQSDPNVRETAVPEVIDSAFAPGMYGVIDSSFHHFSIAIEWSAQSSPSDGTVVIALAPSGDEKTWQEWFASYGEMLLCLQTMANKQVDAEGYDAAAQEAREALPAVLGRFAGGELGQSELFVKCPFLTRGDDGEPEFMWVQVYSLTPDGFVGELRNKSAHDESLQLGTSVTLSTEEIFDWIIEHPDGRLEGGFSRQ